MRPNAAPSAPTKSAPSAPDLDAFARDLKALHDQARASISEEDLAHLRRLERWSTAATLAGQPCATQRWWMVCMFEPRPEIKMTMRFMAARSVGACGCRARADGELRAT